MPQLPYGRGDGPVEAGGPRRRDPLALSADRAGDLHRLSQGNRPPAAQHGRHRPRLEDAAGTGGATASRGFRVRPPGAHGRLAAPHELDGGYFRLKDASHPACVTNRRSQDTDEIAWHRCYRRHFGANHHAALLIHFGPAGRGDVLLRVYRLRHQEHGDPCTESRQTAIRDYLLT